MSSKKFRIVTILIVAVMVGLALTFGVGVDAVVKHKKRGIVAAPVGPVAPFITLDDNPETIQPIVTLTTGYFTAINLPSPPKQLVSRLLDTGVISEQKGKADAGNTVYLTAEKAGKRSNVVIETGYGVVNFNVVTTSGDAFTRMVHVRQSKHEAEVQQLQRQLATADARISSLAGQLEAAQGDLAQAKIAAVTAFREGRAAGLDEQRKASAQDLITALPAWKLKKKKQALLSAWATSHASNKPEGVPQNVTASNSNRAHGN